VSLNITYLINYILNPIISVILFSCLIIFWMKALKTRAYVDRLKGHKDTIICLHSPFEFNGGILYSISVDGGFRGILLFLFKSGI